jgi:hypothetical protein
MKTHSEVRLVANPTDLAEFADDMAQLGPFTARELAIQYLDQHLAPGQDFDAAVKAFTPLCRDYV